MIMRTMLDTIGQNAHLVPEDAETVGWYPDGEFAWTPAEINRFRRRIPTVAIATVSEDYVRCSVFDRELGALTAAQCRRAVVLRNGFRPGTATIYSDFANLGGVLRGCQGLTYHLWIAWWLGQPPTDAQIQSIERQLPHGVDLVAWQYEAGIFDSSAIIDEAWHERVSDAPLAA